MDAFRLILVALAGWMNRRQQEVIGDHQGLQNNIIDADFSQTDEGEVLCRERLGGLLHYYYRNAA